MNPARRASAGRCGCRPVCTLCSECAPTTGRWTSLDPLRYEAGDVNLYRYVNNSSNNLTDPTGLVPPVDLGGGVAYATIEVRPNEGIAEMQVYNSQGKQLIRFRYLRTQPGKIITVYNHGSEGRLPGVPNHLMKKISFNITDRLRRMVEALYGKGAWSRTMVPDVVRAGYPSTVGGRGGGRSGFCHLDALRVLGATAIVVGGATYGYHYYLGQGEKLGQELATRVGLGRALQLLGMMDLLPAGTYFQIVREGQPTIHVLLVQRDGQWYFTACHTEERAGLFWLFPHRVTVEDIRLGEVPAFHTPRQPVNGEYWYWEPGPPKLRPIAITAQ